MRLERIESLDDLIQTLEKLKQSLHDSDVKVEIYDYRYEEYTNIDSIELDNTTNTIKIK